MKNHLWLLLRSGIFGVLIFMGVACGSGDSSSEELAESDSAEEEEMAELRALIESGLSQQTNWHSHWNTQLGEFEAESFELMFEDSIDTMEMPEKNPIHEGDPLFPYQIPHPDGKGTIDIYSYKIEAQANIDRPFLNPDSEVVWYREDGMKQRLLFMGPSGMFEEGMWLNESQFIVFGFFQEAEGYRPMIWMLDLEQATLRQFQLNKLVGEYQTESYINQKIKQVELS